LSSTVKFDNRKALFLERIARAWEKAPEGMTFGRLIVEALGFTHESARFDLLVLRTLEDHALAEAVERYILTGASEDEP
jgi:hypothetical protein